RLLCGRDLPVAGECMEGAPALSYRAHAPAHDLLAPSFYCPWRWHLPLSDRVQPRGRGGGIERAGLVLGDFGEQCGRCHAGDDGLYGGLFWGADTGSCGALSLDPLLFPRPACGDWGDFGSADAAACGAAFGAAA